MSALRDDAIAAREREDRDREEELAAVARLASRRALGREPGAVELVDGRRAVFELDGLTFGAEAGERPGDAALYLLDRGTKRPVASLADLGRMIGEG